MLPIEHHVLLLSSISLAATAKLQEAGRNGSNCSFVAGRDVKDYDTVILRSTPFNADEHPNVKLIVRAGTEANEVTGRRVENGEVCVQMIIGGNSESVAGEVLYAIIGLSRKFHAAAAFVRTELDYSLPQKQFKAAYETAKAKFLGHELPAITVGVIGVGQVGFRVIDYALRLGMGVIAYERERLSALYRLLPPSVIKARSIDEVLCASDIVTVHVPGEDNTHLIGKDRIALMREGAGLINCARAEICDSASILSALNEGRLGGYFTDFPEQALPPDHPLIVALTHEGGNTFEAQGRCGEMAAEQVIDFWGRGNVWPSKNWPSNVLEPTATAVERITVLHHNRPGMLLEFEQAIKAGGINISGQHNSTNLKFGYYIADLDQPLAAEHVEAIRRTSGVVNLMHFRF